MNTIKEIEKTIKVLTAQVEATVKEIERQTAVKKALEEQEKGIDIIPVFGKEEDI